MPHYADGTPAAIGDTVRGTGYNVKHEIVGTVIDVRPGESCTLSVAYIDVELTPKTLEPWQAQSYAHALLVGRGQDTIAVFARTEYGDTKGFSKIA